jgi:hypothetical protein
MTYVTEGKKGDRGSTGIRISSEISRETPKTDTGSKCGVPSGSARSVSGGLPVRTHLRPRIYLLFQHRARA